jgi:hypothetical protein
MIKNLIGIILLSLLVVVGKPYLQIAVNYLLAAEDWVGEALKIVFSGGEAGNVTRELIAILLIPFLIGLIPAIIFWFAKKRWIPCFMHIVWVIWLIEAVALIINYKVAA